MSDTAVAERPKRTLARRDAATVTRILTALVAANGNARLAAKNLAEEDIEIEHSLLYKWRNRTHRDEYMRLREEMLPRIREQQADAHRSLERRQLQVSEEAANLIKSRLPSMENKDLINAMGKADIGSGIHAEKAQLLDDQPTHIVKRSLSEALRELQGLGIDAEQIVDAEVVGEETAALDEQTED